jgi:hypothetical protein
VLGADPLDVYLREDGSEADLPVSSADSARWRFHVGCDQPADGG